MSFLLILGCVVAGGLVAAMVVVAADWLFEDSLNWMEEDDD